MAANNVMMNRKQKIKNYLLLIGCFVLVFNLLAQPKNWTFDFHIETNDFYLLKGSIDGKYKITMQLHETGNFCGDGNNPRWQNRELKGWYFYDKIKTKIPIVGSFNGSDGYNQVKLFVPKNIFDNLDSISCDLEDYTEVFMNENNSDFSKLLWKIRTDEQFKPVDLEEIHSLSYETKAWLSLEIFGLNYFSINLSELTQNNYIEWIGELASAETDNNFYFIFSFGHRSIPGSSGAGYCGAGVEEYIGFIFVNKNLELESFTYYLINSCIDESKAKGVLFDKMHPENGIWLEN